MIVKVTEALHSTCAMFILFVFIVHLFFIYVLDTLKALFGYKSIDGNTTQSKPVRNNKHILIPVVLPFLLWVFSSRNPQSAWINKKLFDLAQS